MQNEYLLIKKVGTFKIRYSRNIVGIIKTVTIKRSLTNKWYVYFSCDNVPDEILPKTRKSVGIDVGIKSFCVDSDGNKFENPKYLRQAEAILRKKQRKLTRRIKGSNRRKKARVQVSKAHEKITNQRNDFLHKLSTYYIHIYDNIYIEDLNIKGMIKNHNLVKSISDSSWGKFFEFLSYKAEGADKKVNKLPRFEPTSKRCNICGEINHILNLNNREWICQSCGTLHDRDLNAAKNILAFGQNVQPLTYEITQCVG